MFTRLRLALRLALTSLVRRVRGLTRPATTLKQPELPAAGATLTSLVSGREEALAAAVGRLAVELLEAKEAQAQLAEQVNLFKAAAEERASTQASLESSLARAQMLYDLRGEDRDVLREQVEDLKASNKFWALQAKRAEREQATALIEKSNAWTVNT